MNTPPILPQSTGVDATNDAPSPSEGASNLSPDDVRVNEVGISHLHQTTHPSTHLGKRKWTFFSDDNHIQKCINQICSTTYQTFKAIELQILGLDNCFWNAIHSKDMDFLQFLLSQTELDERSFSRAIWLAIDCENLDILRLLLSNGRTISQDDMGGCLMKVAGNLNVNMIRFLLSEGRTIDAEMAGRAFEQALEYSSERLPIELKVATLSELMSNGATPRPNIRERGVLFAASQGQVELLRTLLQQGPIRATTRDSARTQATGDIEQIHALLNEAQLGELEFSDIFISNGMQVELGKIKDEWKDHLATICEKGMPNSIFFTDHPNAIDAGGLKKQFISTLSQAIGNHLHLNEEKLPSWEEENVDLMADVGKFFSLLYEQNKDRTDKILTGEILNPLFFDLVKLTQRGDLSEDQKIKETAKQLLSHLPQFTYKFCLDYILDPTPENGEKYVKINKEMFLDLSEDPMEGSRAIVRQFLLPAEGFAKGTTEEFKEILLSKDTEILSLSIQGEAVSSELLLKALRVEGDDSKFQQQVVWLKEKIESSDRDWQMSFLKAVTGRNTMPPGMEIKIKKSWRGDGSFEIHTCFNSLDLPSFATDKKTFLDNLDVVIGANGAKEAEGYNIG